MASIEIRDVGRARGIDVHHNVGHLPEDSVKSIIAGIVIGFESTGWDYRGAGVFRRERELRQIFGPEGWTIPEEWFTQPLTQVTYHTSASAATATPTEGK